jgi:glycosyltransferase involved in cell wall biosynthesis
MFLRARSLYRRIMSGELAYALVTPARNEAENLRRLAGALASQTVRPSAWIVVDDGSTDETRAVIAETAERLPWVGLVESPGFRSRAGELRQGRRAGRDVIAFNAGVEALSRQPDVVVKLDADVSFAPDFFERLMREFALDPRLGITGGHCFELEDGEWRQRFVTGDHVRGATRAYRWACFEDVSPLVEGLGWDGIDETKARTLGWDTRSVAGLQFFHHRRVGQRDGAWSSWESQGATSRFMGYRLPYFVVRTLFRMTRDPKAAGLLVGWWKAALAREERHGDPDVRAYIRSQQRLTQLPARALESVGRR